jgi:preprotein translocase subunit SecE
LARAPVSKTGCCRFESCLACFLLREHILKAPERKEMKKIIRFFKESFAELKKVTWPSREEVASSTKVVLVSVILIAIALGIVDFIIFRGIDLIF